MHLVLRQQKKHVAVRITQSSRAFLQAYHAQQSAAHLRCARLFAASISGPDLTTLTRHETPFSDCWDTTCAQDGVTHERLGEFQCMIRLKSTC
jgi:hypothetical protein